MAPKSHGDDVVSSTSAATIDWPWIEALDADHLEQVDIAKVRFVHDFGFQSLLQFFYASST